VAFLTVNSWLFLAAKTWSFSAVISWIRSRENRAHYLSDLMVKILCEQSANVISYAGKKAETLTMLIEPATFIIQTRRHSSRKLIVLLQVYS
jgi:hypothetical protein